MPQERSQRDAVQQETLIGIVYGTTLDVDVDVNKPLIRNVRTTDDGYQVNGHAQEDGVAFIPLVIGDTAEHFGVEVDIREMDKTLFTFTSTLDVTSTVRFYGLVTSAGPRHLLKTIAPFPIGSVTPALGHDSVTDPWKFIQMSVTAGFGVSAGSFGADFEEET